MSHRSSAQGNVRCAELVGCGVTLTGIQCFVLEMMKFGRIWRCD